MRTFTALVLDFGGVISKTLFETHAETERALGLRPGVLTWRGPFDPRSDPLWRAMQEDQISERDYWLSRAGEVGRLVGETWTTMAQFVSRARGPEPASIVRPEALKLIAHAKASGAKMAILSNELDLFYGTDFRAKLSFLQAFDAICDGTYSGVLKPAAEAYLDCCARIATPPAACVFVDDQHRNIIGAQEAGMRAIHLDVRNPEAAFSEARRLLQSRSAARTHA